MRVFALIAAGLAALASPAAAVTFGNNPYATPDYIAPFGPLPATPTYGQVFLSPRTGTLESFTFWLTGNVGKVRGVVGTWNGGFNYTQCQTTPFCGSPTTLWDSGLLDVAASGAVTFNPNIVILDQTKYVAYISVIDNPDAAGSTTLELGDNSDPWLKYFVSNDGPTDPRNNPAWVYYQDIGDARFSATVGNVPEPAQWGLMIVGFGFAGAVARRRRSGLALAA